jgi:hypothetical protein
MFGGKKWVTQENGDNNEENMTKHIKEVHVYVCVCEPD